MKTNINNSDVSDSFLQLNILVFSIKYQTPNCLICFGKISDFGVYSNFFFFFFFYKIANEFLEQSKNQGWIDFGKTELVRSLSQSFQVLKREERNRFLFYICNEFCSLENLPPLFFFIRENINYV